MFSPRSTVAVRFLGKEEVVGPIPTVGSRLRRDSLAADGTGFVNR